MTLLEVLVSLGILVAGLASVAALMPAAGARLADATAIDRAGTLAANAHADLRNRGILVSSTSSTLLFPINTIISSGSGRISVIGDVFPDDPFASGTFPFSSVRFHKYPTASLAATFSTTLGDDVQLSATTTIVSNSNSVSYGATVVPTATGTVGAGTPVRVGVVVFKRPNVDRMQLPLIRIGSSIFQIPSTVAQPDSIRKRFVPACSWVFAVSSTSPLQSRWLHVASSWTVSGTSFVSFSDSDAQVIAATPVSGTLTVQAFTNVLRVDERPAILK
ncbi:MAG: hypothetical protein RLZZ21_2328 [Planctomycetota bacterium]|jgi:type II secretory pathway pseudopilin PulG